MLRKKLGKKYLVRRIMQLDAMLENDAKLTSNLMRHMIEELQNTKGKEKTKLRNRYIKELTILFGMETDEEIAEIKEMLMQKQKKVVKDESTESK